MGGKEKWIIDGRKTNTLWLLTVIERHKTAKGVIYMPPCLQELAYFGNPCDVLRKPQIQPVSGQKRGCAYYTTCIKPMNINIITGQPY